jgi:hypothetical protein
MKPWGLEKNKQISKLYKKTATYLWSNHYITCLDYANQQILFNVQFVLQITKFTTKNSNLSLIKSVYNLFGLCNPANYLRCTICTVNHQLHNNSTTQLCKLANHQLYSKSTTQQRQINYTTKANQLHSLAITLEAIHKRKIHKHRWQVKGSRSRPDWRQRQ